MLDSTLQKHTEAEKAC